MTITPDNQSDYRVFGMTLQIMLNFWQKPQVKSAQT